MKSQYDVIIVGAGPSGLATAYELSKNTNLSILLIEAGSNIKGRKCHSIENYCVDMKRCNVTHGFGGAGLFSDGKLCIDPSVGGNILDFYQKNDAEKLMDSVLEMLSLDGKKIIPPLVSKEKVNLFTEEFKQNGLNFKPYNVVKLNQQERMEKTQALENYLLSNKVDILLNTKVTDFEKYPTSGKYIITSKNGKVESKYLVFAVGKVGSNWLDSHLEQMGVHGKNHSLFTGVRMEFPKEVTESLINISEDPKISKIYQSGDLMKTHCFSQNGIVVIADYEGKKIVDGNFIETINTKNTAVNIVLQETIPSTVKPFDVAMKYISDMTNSSKGKPLLQRYGDFINNKPTLKSITPNSKIIPSLIDHRPGNIAEIVSQKYFGFAVDFINSIDKVVPGFADSNNLLYAPFVEWWMREIPVNFNFETSLDNLFVVGDGSGHSQGIIAAGMHGIACANGIMEKEISSRKN